MRILGTESEWINEVILFYNRMPTHTVTFLNMPGSFYVDKVSYCEAPNKCALRIVNLSLDQKCLKSYCLYCAGHSLLG